MAVRAGPGGTTDQAHVSKGFDALRWFDLPIVCLSGQR